MPRPIRALTDVSQGHCYSPTFSVNGSPDVFVNDKPVVRIDDNYGQTHCCGPACHQMGPVLGGSTTVFANGKGIHRDGDKISCGDVGDNGSTDVLIDEGVSVSQSQSANAYTDIQDPENTIGYTVGLPVLDYKLNSLDLITYQTCNKIYVESWLSSVGRLAVVPEYYTPIKEEDTGKDIKDETIPKIMSVDPPFPYPYKIDLNTGVITLTGDVTNFYLSSVHVITVNNYVSEYFERPTIVTFYLSTASRPIYFGNQGGTIRSFDCT
jgi:uncharacterized Zn-binding protein involved in type VI secretion